MDRSSRNRLNERHLEHFTSDSLFDKIARTVCSAGCLPRKELYEAWETARRIRRRISGKRVVDMACGHGLLAHMMILLDDTIPSAIAVDKSIPKSAATLVDSLVESWPRLKNRVELIQADLAEIAIDKNDLLVSVHGCGSLTDRIIDLAIEANTSVALLPCCHDLKRSETGDLEGWLEPTLAIDVTRVSRLQTAGYNVITQEIPYDITPKNRLIIATPEAVV